MWIMNLQCNNMIPSGRGNLSSLTFFVDQARRGLRSTLHVLWQRHPFKKKTKLKSNKLFFVFQKKNNINKKNEMDLILNAIGLLDIYETTIIGFLSCMPMLISSTDQKMTVVIGVGGGQDICACLPWFLWLTDRQKKQCQLMNYSFTDDLHLYDKNENFIVAVNSHTTQPTKKNKDYFPELDLAIHLQQTVHAIRLVPFPFLRLALHRFISSMQCKQIILVDGGTDSVLDGHERPYGSPVEDAQMMLAATSAAAELQLPCHLMVCGMDIEGVNTNEFLQTWSTLTVGPNHTQYTMDDPLDGAFQRYRYIVQQRTYTKQASIMHESIISAVVGHRGRYKTPALSQRIENDADYPNLSHLSTQLLWCNAFDIVQRSRFYTRLMLNNSFFFMNGKLSLEECDRMCRRAIHAVLLEFEKKIES